jgi:hypothetical protein
MERRLDDKSASPDRQAPPASSHSVSQNLAQLIRKLRWIGLEQEAKQLEAMVDTLPAEQRGSVSCGPFSTD